ncbi:MAG: hypothetical protein V2A65_09030, partial [Candidatus Omnitrophota bacterium]
GNNVTLNDTGAIDLAASTVSGTLGVTAAGAITDSGDLAVTGATTLAAGTANDITLDNAANDFSSVGITTANNVTLVDANDIVLADCTVSGNFDVTALGNILDGGENTITAETANLYAGGYIGTFDDPLDVDIASSDVTGLSIEVYGMDSDGFSGNFAGSTGSGTITLVNEDMPGLVLFNEGLVGGGGYSDISNIISAVNLSVLTSTTFVSEENIRPQDVISLEEEVKKGKK